MIKDAMGFIQLMCRIGLALFVTYLAYVDVSPKSLDIMDKILLILLFLYSFSAIQMITHNPYK